MGKVFFWFFYTLLLVLAIVINVLGLMIAASLASILLHILCLVISVGFYTYTAANF